VRASFCVRRFVVSMNRSTQDTTQRWVEASRRVEGVEVMHVSQHLEVRDMDSSWNFLRSTWASMKAFNCGSLVAITRCSECFII